MRKGLPAVLTCLHRGFYLGVAQLVERLFWEQEAMGSSWSVNRYYFTFGTSRKFPFRGGWVEVVAPDRKTAVRVFRSKYPDVNEGVVNCSDIYTADQFSKTGMVDGNLGAGCHDILLCQEV